ncbi:MAG: hypothetical protein WBD13_23195 [Burkholderiaceae bacterium]
MDKTHYKPALMGAAAGAILMMVVGFAGLNWHLGSTVDKLVSAAGRDSTVAALSPICVANFQAAAKADDKLLPALKGISTWQRDNYVRDGGYATFPGTEANEAVSEACAAVLTKES